MRRVRTGATLVVLAGLVAFPATATAATTCTATQLPTPAGTVAYDVTGTDGHGTFVGSVTGGSGRQGVVWRDGGVTVLDKFIPLDINESGLMGGYAINQFNGRAVAALRPLDGPVRMLTAGYSTVVNGVNEAGDAVGVVILEHPAMHITAMWRAPDYELEGFFGDQSLDPEEIDDTGLAIGSTEFPDTKATVWSSTTHEVIRDYGPEVRLYDLDNGVIAATRDGNAVTIDGLTGAETAVPGGAGGVPFAIEDGVIVGSAAGGAMLWRGGEAVALPAAPGTTTREASAVDATGTRMAGRQRDHGRHRGTHPVGVPGRLRTVVRVSRRSCSGRPPPTVARRGGLP